MSRYSVDQSFKELSEEIRKSLHGHFIGRNNSETVRDQVLQAARNLLTAHKLSMGPFCLPEGEPEFDIEVKEVPDEPSSLNIAFKPLNDSAKQIGRRLGWWE